MIVSMAMPCASIRRIIYWLGRYKRLSRGSMPSYRLCEWVLAEHYCTEAECKASEKECKVPPVVLRHCSNTTQGGYADATRGVQSLSVVSQRKSRRGFSRTGAHHILGRIAQQFSGWLGLSTSLSFERMSWSRA